jgi:hypothetical protein
MVRSFDSWHSQFTCLQNNLPGIYIPRSSTVGEGERPLDRLAALVEGRAVIIARSPEIESI